MPANYMSMSAHGLSIFSDLFGSGLTTLGSFQDLASNINLCIAGLGFIVFQDCSRSGPLLSALTNVARRVSIDVKGAHGQMYLH